MSSDDVIRLLAAQYPVEKELGGGGMSRVFIAYDAALGRRIVVKVLHPDLGATVNLERFRREIRVAANLAHPHIVPLLNAGQVGEWPFYTMPLIEGESLRAMLDRDGRLPIPDALRLAEEVAGALAYAHRQGIVHRDIKPENILLQDGHAVVTDFGIARAITQSATGSTLTQIGITVGTPAYMSPEQAVGEADVDGRADLYSLGCVLFEMLAGEPPFSGASAQAIIGKHLSAPVPRVRPLRGDVPSAIDDLLTATLAKERQHRSDTATAWVTAVRRAAATTTAAATAATTTVGESIAVLPFTNIGGDAAEDYLSDGITEEILGALTGLDGLRVAARSSAFAFKGEQRDVREIAQRLSVRHLLQGSVRRAGSRLRITAQLVDAETGFQVWSDKFDRDLADIFAMQDEIAGIIARRLDAQFVSRRPAGARAGNTEAYDAYLRGRFHWNQGTPESWKKSVEWYERAIQLDDAMVDAHAGLAEVLALLSFIGATEGAVPRARAAAARALALQGDHASALAVSGFCRCWFDWDFEGALAEMRRALELNPGSASAHCNLTILLANLGEVEAALRHGRRAIELDPLVTSTHQVLQWALACDRRYPEALDRARLALDLAPGSINALFPLAWTYVELHEHAKAIEIGQEILRQVPGHPMGVGTLAVACARSGARDESLAHVAAMEGAPLSPVTCAYLAWAYGALGDLDAAFRWIDRGIDTKDQFMGCMPTFAWWDPMRTDPRFAQAMRRAGFPSWTFRRTHEAIGRAQSLTAAPPPAAGRPSVAVLPFENLSTDAENEYFAEGITEDLIAQLARIRALRVISKTSTSRFRRTDRPPSEIARDLGVRTMVTGSVRRAGSQVRIVARLIDPATDAHLWTETYDRALDDVFAVQADVALKIAAALEANLTSDERRRLDTKPTDDAKAYDLVLLGRHHWTRRNDESLRKAIECFEGAIARDATYAAAYAGLADTYLFAALGYASMNTEEAFAKAESAAARAIALDDSGAEGHCAQGMAALHHGWDIARARQAFQRAIDRNPNYATAHQFLAWCAFSSGDYAGAVEVQQRALALDPINPTVVAESGWPFSYAGLHELALVRYLKAIEIDPTFGLAHYNAGMSHHGLGRYDRATKSYDRALELMGRNAWVLAWQGITALSMGARDRAEQLLAEVEAQAAAGVAAAMWIALLRDALGLVDRAIEALEQGHARREPFLFVLTLEGWLPFSNSRAHPRFQQLLRTMGVRPHDVAGQRRLLLERFG